MRKAQYEPLRKFRSRFHSSQRVDCPQCGAGALAPVVDHALPEGIDRTKGYCFACQKTIGMASPKELSEGQRSETLETLHAKSTQESILLRNGLAQYLLERYGTAVVDHLRHWDVGTDGVGNTVFWYRTDDGQLATAKAVPYDSATGKRRKDSDSPISWTKDGRVHTADQIFGLVEGRRPDGSLKITSFSRERGYSVPLYGAQFLTEETLDSPVLLVEAEKTAVVASLFLPEFVVVASGGSGALTSEKASALIGRDVYILTDADEAGRRGAMAAEEVLLSVGARPVVDIDGAMLVDVLMPDAPKGYDLADHYLSQTLEIPQAEVVTAEIPQSLPEPQPERKEPEQEPVTAEIPQSDVAPLPSTREGLRTALLRAFGRETSLPLEELHDRIRDRRIAGGASLVSSAIPERLLSLSYRHDSGTYVATLKGGA